MNEITLNQAIKCVKRELALRKRMYPKWVAQERMTLVQATEEIACMEFILAHLLHEDSLL